MLATSLRVILLLLLAAVATAQDYNAAPGRPRGGAASYTWSLGDLNTDLASRVATDWRFDEWADGYDTEAELNALGWETVTIDGTTDADGFTDTINCAAGGSGSDEDEADMDVLIKAACETEPSGNTPGECNKVFEIAASCTVDLTSDTTNAINGTAGAYIGYSNIAFIGADPDTSKILGNNTVTVNTDMVGPLLSTNNAWYYYGGADGSTYTRGAGAITKGTTTLTLTTCTGLATGDLIRVNGTDEDGADLTYQTEVTMSSCVATLADPLPTTFNAITGVTERGGNMPRNQIFLNFTLGFPFLPDGVGTNASDLSNASLIRTFGVRRLLVQDMNLGDFGAAWLSTTAGYQLVVRHNTIGRGLHTLRRQNNASGGMTQNSGWWDALLPGALISFYDNAMLEGAIRIWPNDRAYNFAYIGFNWQKDQLPSNGAEGGNYCSGITTPQGFANVSSGPERSMFFNHDDATSGISRVLAEANDFKCNVQREGYDPLGRYVTMYRNRIVGQNDSIIYAAGSTEAYMNWVANRVGTFAFSGTGSDVAMGRYNVAEAATDAPVGTSVDWPTTGVGKNYQDATGAHDDYPADMPPSLAFQTDTAPSWWCQESGDWDGSWSFAYGDGGDNGGTPRKLPAQIRAEGGTCTPP